MDRINAMSQFVTVVESGSFSAAARIVGQGQPTLSKSVAQLERRLGIALLMRTTRAVSLTDAGRIFYQHAKTVLDAIEEAEAAAKGAAAALTGRLRICAPITFSRLHIVPNLPGFMKSHPGLDIDLVLDDRRIDLVEEGIDVAIRAGPLPDSSMIAVHIATGERLVIASPDFWARYPKVEKPSDLACLPFVAYGSAPGGLDWTFIHKNKAETVHMQKKLRTSGLEGVREAVFAGLGLAVMSRWACADAIADGRAVAVLENHSLPAVELWAIFPAGRQPSPRARIFAEFIKRTVSGIIN